jgi:hypothetical protein
LAGGRHFPEFASATEEAKPLKFGRILEVAEDHTLAEKFGFNVATGASAWFLTKTGDRVKTGIAGSLEFQEIPAFMPFRSRPQKPVRP